jgi:plasmid stabilization system protein ParE
MVLSIRWNRIAIYQLAKAIEKYKRNNDGSFRAFELHRYRITYRIRNNEIRIIRIRHTKRTPLGY